ncbi:MAG: aminoacyl-histidine dipeptidase [Pirellulaceae bacterium]|nr:aminoacyl-histidine dipeptidase [Pirellulaceae bacterium]
MLSVRELEPRRLWNHFTDLNSVPRPSKKEEQVIQFAKNFGESLGLETIVDSIGNVIIRKPATSGMEDRLPIVMQSHLDMVCQKNEKTAFDFESQGINMFVDEDWVKADGTTLGADNGIGVAAIMAILSSKEIGHPSLEALFTIDEETGMTGAIGLEPGMLSGRILLNLDTEEDNELTIGCAGGVDITLSSEYESSPAPSDSIAYQLDIRGLKGGHSGVDIHLGRANANQWMNRLIWHASSTADAKIGSIEGGGLRNAIPRESSAVLAIPTDKTLAFEKCINEQSRQLLGEYESTDPDAKIEYRQVAEKVSIVDETFQTDLLSTLYTCPNGIYRMSPDIQDLVQTSNNLARVLVNKGCLEIGCLTRSSVNSERDDLANAIQVSFQKFGGDVRLGGKYPGWTPRPESKIVHLMSGLYRELFDEDAHVAACHAGLECGILGRHYPEMEMISFGPNIFGAHSPDERVQISSVQKFWRFLLETLQRIPTTA